jgi:hypothetical protein
MLKSGRWARRWDKCRECASDAEAHYANGYCARCYMRLYKRTQRRAQREQAAYQEQVELRRDREQRADGDSHDLPIAV